MPNELKSVFHKVTCCQCAKSFENSQFYVNLNLLEYEQIGIKDLEGNIGRAIESRSNKTRRGCNDCFGTTDILRSNLNKIILVDIQLPDEQFIVMNDIPENITITKEKFSKVGMIEFIPPERGAKVGH